MSITFGQYIKNARIARGLTLRAAAKASGIDVSDWSKMERGVNAAPRDDQRAYAIIKTLWPDTNCERYYNWAHDSWTRSAPVVTDADIDDHLPVFLRLTPEQETGLRPLIRESLTRNPAF